jgi:hypothetical protein
MGDKEDDYDTTEKNEDDDDMDDAWMMTIQLR